MNLETARLTLTQLSSSDIPEIHAMNSYPEVAKYNTIGIPHALAQTADMLQSVIADVAKETRTQYGWAIREKESGLFIGELGMSVSSAKYNKGEVHYSLVPDQWGNGYASEAVREVLNFGFDHLKLHRIEAGVAVENEASIRLLERVGMSREGRHRKILPLATGWNDNFSFAILEEDPRP